jgi:hypothetical protein
MDDTVQAEVINSPTEKQFSQADLDALAGRVRQEARLKYEKDAMSQSQMSEERARQIAQEESAKHSDNIAKVQLEQMQRQAAQEMVGQFNNKISAGKEKYPDIEQKISELRLDTMPELVRHAISVDNTAEFMNEIANHPQKALDIVTAERLGNHALAQKLSRNLSNSINENLKAAANAETPREPLRHVKPSNVGGDDGQMSIADLRKQKHLKG